MICHTQFCDLITFPPFSPVPTRVAPWAPEQVSSSFYQTLQLTCFGETPQSLTSLRREAVIPGRDKWKYFQTMSCSQSKCCKRTKESSNWQSSGWERTHFKGEISFLLLLGFASFSLTFSHSLQWHLLVAMITMVAELLH